MLSLVNCKQEKILSSHPIEFSSNFYIKFKSAGGRRGGVGRRDEPRDDKAPRHEARSKAEQGRCCWCSQGFGLKTIC